MGARQADCVWDSHHANGVANTNNKTVVEVANAKVN
jgi:hypothetical protein